MELENQEKINRINISLPVIETSRPDKINNKNPEEAK